MKGMDMKSRIELELRGKDASTIKELNLDSCRAQQLDGLTDNFKSLEILSLINVGLTNLKGFPKLPSLRKLELSDNRVSGGLDNLIGCDCLTHLNLSGNKFKEIEVLAPLAQLPQLRNLDLFNCDVTQVDQYREKIFKLLPNLKFLDGFDQNEQEEDEYDGENDDDDDDDEDEDEDSDEDEGEHGGEGEDGENDDEDDDDEEDEDDENGENYEDEEDVEDEEAEAIMTKKSMLNGGKKGNNPNANGNVISGSMAASAKKNSKVNGSNDDEDEVDDEDDEDDEDDDGEEVDENEVGLSYLQKSNLEDDDDDEDFDEQKAMQKQNDDDDDEEDDDDEDDEEGADENLETSQVLDENSTNSQTRSTRKRKHEETDEDSKTQ